VFGRVVPFQNYQWKKGLSLLACGAWQIGVRFSYLDVNDKAVQDGPGALGDDRVLLNGTICDRFHVLRQPDVA
jgi:hypothetical protein